MKARGTRVFPIAICVAALLCACARDPGPPADPRDVIELRWLKAYERESRSDVETGLLWGLSLLGAQLPKEAKVIRWHGDVMTVDLAHAQVQPGTLPAWRELIAALKASGEYQVHGALDVGRFMAVALGDSDRYYALTGATPDYQTARQRYRFDSRSAGIVKSMVALGSRRIEMPVADTVEQLAFVAFEGHGSFASGTFVDHEVELLDVMHNGQLRFALYTLDGHLKRGATPELTNAGKPAKCMWCHESGLQHTYIDYPAASGYYSRSEFDAAVARQRDVLIRYRDQLDTQIEYRNRQDHTFAELLYLTFEEPSRERLAREWGVPVERAAEILRGLPTHPQPEFAWLGKELYRRADVDALAPYPVFAAPQSVRELDGHAPVMAARP